MILRKAFLHFVKGSLFILSGFMSKGAEGVTVSATSVGTLPGVLYESSALDFTGGSSFWSLDDSGRPEIFKITGNGSLSKTVTITNAQNRNWEDMTHDAARNYMFIGDFGNNNNDRTNLRVFRIPYPSLISGTTTTAVEIDFSYPDQQSFPSQWLNFDAESFFHFQNKLFIFSKADGNAIGYTKMYSIPDSPGNYVATLIDSFYTNDRTTSADISPDGKSIILISNTHIHIFRNFSGTNFFSGEHTQINISGQWTQKEAVSFSSNNEIFLTDENNGSGNHLYYIDLNSWIPASSASTNSIEKINDVVATVYPIPADKYLTVLLQNTNEEKYTFSLFDITGKNVFEARIENNLIPFNVRTEDFTPGIYFYKVFSDVKEIQTSRIVISH